MSYDIKRSSTNEYFIFMQDSAVTTYTAGKAGLIHSDVTAYYCPAAGVTTQLALTGTGTKGVTNGYFREIDATNQPGIYGVTFTAGTVDGEIPFAFKASSTRFSYNKFQIMQYMAADAAQASALATVQADTDALQVTAATLATTAHVQEVEDKLDIVDTVADGIAANGATSAALATLSTKIGTPAGASVSADIAAIVAGVWTNGTRTLTSLGASLIAEIWNALLTTITTAGSVGKLIKDYLDVAVSSRAASSGTGASLVTWTITNATSSALLEGVTITVYASGVKVNTAVTGSLGTATMNLNDGSYTFDLDLTGSYISRTALALTVSGTTTNAKTLTPLPLSAAGSAYQSTITGTALTGLGTAYAASKVIKVRLNVPVIVNGVACGHDSQSIAIDDVSGVWSANFYRQADCVHDTLTADRVATADIFYYFTHPDGRVTRKVIPDSSTALYSALTDYS